jgi:putative membrane protein
MMYGYGTGMGSIWALIIFAIVLPSLLLAAALIAAQLRRPPQEPHMLPPAHEAERLLAERFARGEIDSEEYERRLATLRVARR